MRTFMVWVPELRVCPIAYTKGPVIWRADTNVGVVEAAGAVTALASSVTAVCASNRPFADAPAPRLMAVWVRMIPSK